MRQLTGLVLGFLTSTVLYSATNAEKIFDDKCLVYHVKNIPQDMSNMTAPSLMGIMRHFYYKKRV